MKAFNSFNHFHLKSFRLHCSYSQSNLLPHRRQLFIHRGPTIQTTRWPSSSHRRYNSAWQKFISARRPSSKSLKSFAYGAAFGGVFFFGKYYITDTRAGAHQWLVVPALRWFYDDAEKAHEAGIEILKTLYDWDMHPRERGKETTGELGVELFGQTLLCPLAISAGLDKNGDIMAPLFALGPSIVEIGGITPLPQQGNPKPRVFRVPSESALINRYGFNSQGAAYVADKLRERVKKYAESTGHSTDDGNAEKMILDGEAGVPSGSLAAGKLLAIQIAKNSSTSEADLDSVKRDYVDCVKQLAPYADILVVNVSSPNQKGLRNLQKQEPLQELLDAVTVAAKEIHRKIKPAIMVKVSPDEDSDEDIAGICNAVWKAGVDGIIVANTTRGRPSLQSNPLPAEESKVLMGQGGYSGPLMFPKTLALVKKYRQVLDQSWEAVGGQPASRKVIFASGGICSGENVKEVLDAGASVAMVYTTLSTNGVGAITAIKKQLREIRQK